MDHDIDGMPPYSADGEIYEENSAFSNKCEFEAQKLANAMGWKLHDPVMTRNNAFGLVWRVDYDVPDGVDSFTNRIMFWSLKDGTLAKFSGANLPVPLLKSR